MNSLFGNTVQSLDTIIEHFADALATVDRRRPSCKSFKPGIGPFGEKEGVKMIFDQMRASHPGLYDDARPIKLEGCPSAVDIVIGEQWAIEFKVARPYGDNGMLAEHWITNMLYPYPGNYSMLGDGMKLLDAQFPGKRALIVYGFEHAEPRTVLETAIRAFELVAKEVIGLPIGKRKQCVVEPLVHPVHARAIVAGWELG